MKKIITMVILFTLLTTVFIYGHGPNIQDNSLDFEEITQSQWETDEVMTPNEILHHTCGRGGTRCYGCYHKTSNKSCGCVYYLEYCCCGKEYSFELVYCQKHKRY